jgi:hypothetical protein
MLPVFIVVALLLFSISLQKLPRIAEPISQPLRINPQAVLDAGRAPLSSADAAPCPSPSVHRLVRRLNLPALFLLHAQGDAENGLGFFAPIVLGGWEILRTRGATVASTATRADSYRSDFRNP